MLLTLHQKSSLNPTALNLGIRFSRMLNMPESQFSLVLRVRAEHSLRLNLYFK